MKWPERKPEGPAGEIRAPFDLGLKAVRVAERVGAASELVTRQPELPERLQVVAGGGGARRAMQPLRQKPVVRLLQRGPRGDGAGAEVQRDYEPDKPRAAEMSSSRYGTSTSSYAHAARTVP